MNKRLSDMPGYDERVKNAQRREAKSKLMDVEYKQRKSTESLEKAKAAYKYFSEPVTAAPSPTDATDHNGKYFQSISEGKPTIEKC